MNSPPPTAARWESVLWRFLAALGAAAVVAWSVVASVRLAYPFGIDWMEGGMVDHAARVRDGLPLYGAPSLEHTPFLYTPLFYWLGAVAWSLFGDGMLALRSVAVLGTVASGLAVGALVHRHSGDRRLAWIAASLFIGGYGYANTHYDLARNDTVGLAPLLATAALLATPRPTAPWLAAVTGLLAFLAKQSALPWLFALLVGALFENPRRGCRFGVALLGLLAAVILGWQVASDGWFCFYVFEMPAWHPICEACWTSFWTADLVPLSPLLLAALVVCGCRLRREGVRRSAPLVMLLGGGVGSAWLGRLHVGGVENVLISALASAIVVGSCLPAVVVGRAARGVALGLLLLQWVMLVLDVRALWVPGRDWLQVRSSKLLPTAAQRDANERLVELLRAQPGPVLEVFRGNMAALAGKPRTVHVMALIDLGWAFEARPGRPPLAGNMLRAAEALARVAAAAELQHRFTAIVIDLPGGAGLQQTLAPILQGCSQVALAPELVAGLAMPLGYTPQQVLVFERLPVPRTPDSGK